MNPEDFVEKCPYKFAVGTAYFDAWIRPKEIETIQFFCEMLHINKYLEIGTWEGFSAYMIKHLVKEIWCIDHTPTDRRYKSLNDYVIRPNDNIHLIREKSEVVGPLLKEKYFDMILIDGDHSYESCYKDIEMYFPKLKVGGMFLVHDYNHPDD